MGKSTPVKIYTETYEKLRKVQEALPGNPSIVSLIDEAVQLLTKKYLKKEDKNAKP